MIKRGQSPDEYTSTIGPNQCHVTDLNILTELCRSSVETKPNHIAPNACNISPLYLQKSLLNLVKLKVSFGNPC